MTKSIIKKPPIFIPHPTQAEGNLLDLHQPKALLMDAHIFAGAQAAAKKIKQMTDLFIIDPMTYCFFNKHLLEKKFCKKLKTAPQKPLKIKDLLIADTPRKKFVYDNIKYQIDNGAELIIIPYVYTDSAQDAKLGLNLSMISDALKIRDEHNISLPFFAMINIGKSVINQEHEANFLLDRYYDDYAGMLQGYFVRLNNFNSLVESEDCLFNFARLVFDLSKEQDTFVLNIDDFGYILSAIGATGYSSGIATSEKFNYDNKMSSVPRKGGGRNHTEEMYVPEIFGYLNKENLREFGYLCSCKVCKGSIPSSHNQTRKHYLACKIHQTSKISNLSRGKRIDLLIVQIDEAESRIHSYNRKKGLNIKSEHLSRWRDLLKRSKEWSHTPPGLSSAVNLGAIIEEVRKNK